MKRHRHTPEQIVRKLREGDRLLNEGRDLAEVLRQLEVSESSWNRWRAEDGGMKANQPKRLRELESENARLKKLLAEAELEGHAQGAGGGKLLPPGRRRRAVVGLVDRFGVSQRRGLPPPRPRAPPPARDPGARRRCVAGCGRSPAATRGGAGRRPM